MSGELDNNDKAYTAVQDKIRSFIAKLYIYAGSGVAFLALILIVLDVAFKQPFLYIAITAGLGILSGVSVIAAKRGKVIESGIIFLVGVSSVIIGSIYVSPNFKGNLLGGLAIVIVLAGFTIGPRACVAFTGTLLFCFIGVLLLNYASEGFVLSPSEELIFFMDIALLSGLIGIFGVTVYIISNHAKELRDGLADRLDSIESFVPKIAESGSVISSAAQEIHVLANQQKQGASEQSVAIAEIRQSLQSLLEASVKISEVAQIVRANAEQTLQNSEVVATHILDLSNQTNRITEIVESIRGIASKSDLLSLNAALEGTKAGEYGRGFSLVAEQMRRLTENIMESLNSIKAITNDIVSETNATKLSTELAIKIAHATTEAGSEIEFITKQQQSSTEQITSTMQDITVVSKQVADGSKQALESTMRLHEFASDLPTLLKELQTSSA